jgi:hypothetical protein
MISDMIGDKGWILKHRFISLHFEFVRFRVNSDRHGLIIDFLPNTSEHSLNLLDLIPLSIPVEKCKLSFIDQ